MKTVNLTCANCKAGLDVDLENLQAYCPYCGSKLMIDLEDMDKIFIEREKTKRKVLDHEHGETILDKKQTYELEMFDRKEKAERRKERNEWLPMVIMFVVAFVMLFVAGFFEISNGNAEEDRLNGIVSQVETYIENGEYSVAMDKVQTIEYTENDSDKKEEWATVKASYIDKVSTLIAGDESIKKAPFPCSSNDISSLGKKYIDAATKLKEAGFTNIQKEPVKDLKLGILNTQGQITRITVDGKEVFSKGEQIRTNAVIIIEYHEFED